MHIKVSSKYIEPNSSIVDEVLKTFAGETKVQDIFLSLGSAKAAYYFYEQFIDQVCDMECAFLRLSWT